MSAENEIIYMGRTFLQHFLNPDEMLTTLYSTVSDVSAFNAMNHEN